jgi:hypothetical protein
VQTLKVERGWLRPTSVSGRHTALGLDEIVGVERERAAAALDGQPTIVHAAHSRGQVGRVLCADTV